MGADGFALPANQWGPGGQGAEQRAPGLCPEAAGKQAARPEFWQPPGGRVTLIGIGSPRTRVPAAPLAVPGSLNLGAVIICSPLQRYPSRNGTLALAPRLGHSMRDGRLS